MIGLFRLLPHTEAYGAHTTSLTLQRTLLQMASLGLLPYGISGTTNKATIPTLSSKLHLNYISVNGQTGNEKSGFRDACLGYREDARGGGKAQKALKQFHALRSKDASDKEVKEAQYHDIRATLGHITGTQGASLE